MNTHFVRFAGIALLLGLAHLAHAADAHNAHATPANAQPPSAPIADHTGQRRILHYKSQMGPETSPVPKQDDMGMDYLPVYAPPAEPAASAPDPHASGAVPAEPTSGATASPASAPRPAEPHADQPRRILYYRAPMSADTSPVPRKDQMGMDYVPVYADSGSADGTVTVSPQRVQILGVRTEAAREQAVSTPVRAVGTVAADERRITVVAPRFEGWIQDLFVNVTGETVQRGEPLFTFYSPETAAAAREYLVARQVSASVAEAARAKLRNLGIPTTQIGYPSRHGSAADVLTYTAPADGTVMEKTALAGLRFAAGETLYRIADLSRVWVLAEVFEQDLAAVHRGETADIRLTAYPGRSFTGTVSFIYPTLNPATRTVRIRIELANPDGLLKPDMYATVVIATGNDRPVLTIPDSALLDDGTRQIVLVERAPGRYQPRVVATGRRGNGDIEITSGLAAGEKVVVAANFLIDSESNISGALRQFAAPASAGTAGKQK